MRQLPSDKYNVAWFKLAEFVVRGEKERALGLYRLLVHSFDDKALAYQLEGDLLLSFKDIVAAQEKYICAAQVYKAGGRLIESAAIYEHLHTLAPQQEDFLYTLLELYQILGLYQRCMPVLKEIGELCIQKGLIDTFISLLHEYETCLEISHNAELYGLLTLALAKNSKNDDEIAPFLAKTIDFLLLSSDTQQMPSFLMKLDAINHACYQKALHYIKA